jgi:hypothetical protein
MTSKKPKPYSWRSTFMRFLGASILLSALLVLVLVTAAPTASPVSRWTIAIDTIWYKVRPVTDRAQLEKMHASASSMAPEQCIACHGTMLSSTLRLHRIHLTSDLLPGLKCTDCHKKINLQQRTNTYVVRMVDISFCEKCHSTFPGLQVNSPMQASDFKADCTTCHSGKNAYRHNPSYLSQVIAPRECAGCHGGRVLPWTLAHERDDWLQTHGPEALSTGSKACMQCHEYGMQFCDACHKLKPPSHLPSDVWLNQHAAKAQQDTRACFTCHKTADCKKCHINHPPDWLAQHPAVVRAQGTASCLATCHSRSWCSFCHADQAGAK